MQKFLEKNYRIIILLILIFMISVSLLNANNDSLIYDESAHIPAGYSYLTQHDMRLNPEHPPLLKDLAALPLLFIQPKFETTADFWTKDNADASQWNAGKSFLFASGNNPDQIVFWSRLPIILLSLLLGLFIFKWTRELAGLGAGLFALTLYAFDPNILGHNHFVTTDVGIAAFITFAFYYFLHFIKEPTRKNMLLAGLFLGLVQLAKFSAVLTFPVFGLLLIIYPLVRLHGHKSRWQSLGEYLWKGCLVFLISFLVVYVAYFLNTYQMPPEKLPEIMSHYMHPDDPRPLTVYTRKAILAINSVPLLEPMANYVFGVVRVFQRVGGGNVTYFLGEVSVQGFLSYFPVIFMIKEPLPTIFLILFTLTIAFIAIVRSIFSEPKKIGHHLAYYLRTRVIEFSMLTFITLYALTSITGRLNIGLRHLLPIFPFMYILLSVGLFRFIRKKHNDYKHLLYLAAVTLLGILIFQTIAAYPSYTSYFNSLAGGPTQGYRFATDSNADWGQDLKRLHLFLTAHPEITKIKTDYFGMVDLDYYIGGRYEKWWAAKRPLEPGWYAISTLFLQEGIYDTRKSNAESYRWLKNKTPLYQVGTSILIYHLTPGEIN
jgi:4-amino-4-deoxy-L-arabinose transferase-like glycosyltransferase